MKNNPYTGLLCWLTILLAVCCLPLKAGHYYYKQISLKEGLPSTVRCVYTEPKGFVWIGTNAGLGRFDGEKLKKYIHRKEDAHSLPHNYIHQIIEDNQHNIWRSIAGKATILQLHKTNRDIPSSPIPLA